MKKKNCYGKVLIISVLAYFNILFKIEILSIFKVETKTGLNAEWCWSHRLYLPFRYLKRYKCSTTNAFLYIVSFLSSFSSTFERCSTTWSFQVLCKGDCTFISLIIAFCYSLIGCWLHLIIDTKIISQSTHLNLNKLTTILR